jgi:hypothetical protein
LTSGLVGVGEAHGLHRAETQGFAAAFGHDLDRQATVEITGCLTLVKFGLVGGQKRVDEGFILVTRHRAIHVGGLFLDRFALVVARLHPGHRHVDAFGIDDGGDGVEEGQSLGTSFGADRLGQGTGGQRAGGNDPVAG